MFPPIAFLLHAVIVKASNGPRYVVGCRRQVSSSGMQLIILHLDSVLCTIMSVSMFVLDGISLTSAHDSFSYVS